MANPPSRQKSSWFRFRYNEDVDTMTDTRNVLLIVATLITAVTFQAGVNPPGGVWQEDKEGEHKAGRAIYSAQKGPFYAFLIANTLAYSTSTLVLISLTYSFPFHIELWSAIMAMVATYASAIFAVAPDESVKFRYLLITAALPYAIRILLEIYIRLRIKNPAS